LNYVHNNPVEAGTVDEPEEYLNSSARDYHYGKHCGLLTTASFNKRCQRVTSFSSLLPSYKLSGAFEEFLLDRTLRKAEIYFFKYDRARKMLKYYWNNDSLQAISYFNNDKKDGPWQEYFENGTVSAFHFLEMVSPMAWIHFTTRMENPLRSKDTRKEERWELGHILMRQDVKYVGLVTIKLFKQFTNNVSHNTFCYCNCYIRNFLGPSV
jgi:hypothetical protein